MKTKKNEVEYNLLDVLNVLIYKPIKKSIMAKYSKKAGDKVERAMHEMHEGKLRSGSKKGPKVTSRKQAIAIGLSEAREEGAKVPKKAAAKKATGKKATGKKATAKRATGKKATAKKATAKKATAKRATGKKAAAKKAAPKKAAAKRATAKKATTKKATAKRSTRKK
ncbi:DUF6496 domain-containing protein [Chitinophaga niabensis]|uniref:Histone H1-like nucleoprotein HC2 n=1 Tax=Chitinophaga niabensis TaxID=536979 RepID=A0A1N6JZR0_9BACT|nr:DUF6496 domain-containing protein [Chitinophaga niabensis]SIO49713.1 hypothetical protein SAMN04488055_4766 [Chitinophaga niabensis]